MRLEAMIKQTWTLYSCECGYTVGGWDQATLEKQMEAGTRRVWTSTGRQSMHGAPSIDTLFIR